MKFPFKKIGALLKKAVKWAVAHPDTVKDVVDAVKDHTDKDGK